jgi:hypothetical protein
MGGKAEYRPQHRLARAVAAHAFPRTRELRWWNSGGEAWEVWQGGRFGAYRSDAPWGGRVFWLPLPSKTACARLPVIGTGLWEAAVRSGPRNLGGLLFLGGKTFDKPDSRGAMRCVKKHSAPVENKGTAGHQTRAGVSCCSSPGSVPIQDGHSSRRRPLTL